MTRLASFALFLAILSMLFTAFALARATRADEVSTEVKQQRAALLVLACDYYTLSAEQPSHTQAFRDAALRESVAVCAQAHPTDG